MLVSFAFSRARGCRLGTRKAAKAPPHVEIRCAPQVERSSCQTRRCGGEGILERGITVGGEAAAPGEGDWCGDDGAFPLDEAHGEVPVAGATMAADLIKTGGFGAPAVFHNPDGFASTVSGGGRGLRDPHTRGLTPRFSAAADAN